MEHDIRLIALDLDGTLTNERKEITPLTYNALMKAQQQGIRLCLASGRPPYGMRPLADQLHMSEHGGILMCYNGGHVEECSTGKVLVERKLDEECLPILYDYQKLSGLTLMTYHGCNIYTEHADDQYVRQSSRNNKMEIIAVDNFIADTPRPLNKCLMVGPPSDIPEWEQRMAKDLKGKMHICRSTPYFIECLPNDIDKGTALADILTSLNLTTKNAMAFGDSYNDITMLQTAGIGVAMGNAEDAIKAVSNHVTTSNEDDGVAIALRHILHL